MRLICRAEECDDNESFEVRILNNGKIILVCDRCGKRYELVKIENSRRITMKESK